MANFNRGNSTKMKNNNTKTRGAFLKYFFGKYLK